MVDKATNSFKSDMGKIHPGIPPFTFSISDFIKEAQKGF